MRCPELGIPLVIKTLQKHLLVNAASRLVRLEALVADAVIQQYPDGTRLQQAFQASTGALWSRLHTHKQGLLAVFSPQAVDADQCQRVWDEIKTLQDAVDQLTAQAQAILPMALEPECHLFLNSALPLAAMPTTIDERLVLLVESVERQQTPASALNQGALAAMLLEQLPWWGVKSPETWVALGESWAHEWVQAHLRVEALARLNKQLGSQVATHACAKAAVLLRVLGPAYYWHLVLEGTASKNQRAMAVVEPVLFYGLNHWGYSHKSLVMFHEAAEKVREWIHSQAATPHDAVGQPNAESLGELYRAIDQALPDKLCFSEKCLGRAEQLMERLANQTLASSLPTYEPTGLAPNEAQSANTIYDQLQHLTESPVTPIEMVNATWLLRVERAPIWLFDWLMTPADASPSPDPLAANSFVRRVLSTDALVCKSIETAQVHQMLLDAPVPTYAVR
jgi:hypothetical protein